MNKSLSSTPPQSRPGTRNPGSKSSPSGEPQASSALAASSQPRQTVGRQDVPSPSSADRRQEVVFELNASSAKEVLLAGDFTGWEKTPIRLRKGDRGNWNTSVKLPPGHYHYKFVVDGQWRDDPSARAKTPNPFGTCDSVLEIQ